MAKINSETKFVRSANYKTEKGTKVSMIFQPYIVGIYLAIYEGSRIALQSSVAYSDLSKLVKNLENDLKKDNTDVSVNYGTLGSFLKETDLELINS
jgi:hypothetical protein